MFYRLDETNTIAEKIPAIADEKGRPIFHPDIIARVFQIDDRLAQPDLGWIYDPATKTVAPPVIVPPVIDPTLRLSQIERSYIVALLTRNADLARQLETEYIALTINLPATELPAPAVPGNTSKDDTL